MTDQEIAKALYTFLHRNGPLTCGTAKELTEALSSAGFSHAIADQALWGWVNNVGVDWIVHGNVVL